MAQYWYERMAATDRPFLVFEQHHTHMHVGGTTIFDAAPLRLPHGGIDIERVRTYIGSRLHLIPRYRQRLMHVPIDGSPVWVDDDRLNLHYHVRHTSLPRPGDVAQLKRLSARIMSQRLDRRRPLWEVWMVEGLEDDRLAMILKTHHCVVDGVSGVDLMSVLLRPEADDNFEASPNWIPRPTPSTQELFRDEVLRRVTQPLEFLRLAQSWANGLDFNVWPDQLRDQMSSAFEFVSAGLKPPAATPLNQPIGPHRRFDYHSVALADAKAIKNRLGGTINDVILTTVAGALRRYLRARGCDVESIDFKTVVPVNVRTGDEIGQVGNRVAAWLLTLPLGEPEAHKRYQIVRETTTRLKESQQVRGISALSQVAEYFDTILTLGVRLAATIHPYNLIISNVPGPQFPLYLLGSRLLEGYPIVPLFEYQGLGVATFSYDGKLFMGLNADWDIVPDLGEFVIALRESFAELQRAGEDPPIAARRAPTRIRAARGRRAGRVDEPKA